MDGISSILLAAGESTRMGTLKALLPWQGLTLIEYQLNSLKKCGVNQITVVLGYRNTDIAERIKTYHGVDIIFNQNYLEGKTTSIKAGASNINPSSSSILILSVDQPRPPELISRILVSHIASNKLITFPTYHGKGGHPILFDISLLPAINEITEEEEGLRKITSLHADSVNRVSVEDPIATLDLNTPSAFEDAVHRFGSPT